MSALDKLDPRGWPRPAQALGGAALAGGALFGLYQLVASSGSKARRAKPPPPPADATAHPGATLVADAAPGQEGQGVPAHAKPGGHHPVLVTLPHGVEVVVVEAAEVGGRRWYKVRGLGGEGREAWVRGHHLRGRR